MVFVTTITVLTIVSRTAREQLPGHNVYSIEKSEDALGLWRSLGLRGRVVLYFDDHLSLDEEFLESLSIRFATMDHIMLHEDNHNYFLLALYNGVFRKVFHIVPEQTWQEIQGKLSGYPFIKDSGRQFRYTIEGIPIIVTRISDIPPLPEKPVVYISSGYLRDHPGPALDRIVRDRYATDVVVIRRDRD